MLLTPTQFSPDGTNVRADVRVPAHITVCVKNLLRHALMADVRTQAVTHVTFNVYECPLEDELVAMRLGQLAVRGDTPYAFRIRRTADADAPLTWVTSDDIDDPCARVVMPNSGRFVLAPLLAGATFDVVCHTRAGTGRAHAMWNSVHVARPQDDVFRLETTGALGCTDTWNAAIHATVHAMRAFIRSCPTATWPGT